MLAKPPSSSLTAARIRALCAASFATMPIVSWLPSAAMYATRGGRAAASPPPSTSAARTTCASARRIARSSAAVQTVETVSASAEPRAATSSCAAAHSLAQLDPMYSS